MTRADDAAPRPVPEPPGDGWSVVEDSGFLDLVGPIWRRDGPEGFALGFRPEARHANLVGNVHGGMLMSLADRALGLAAWEATGGRPAVTVQFSTQFVAAGRIGDWLTVEPRIVRATSALVFARGEVRAADRVVASAEGVWRVLAERG